MIKVKHIAKAKEKMVTPIIDLVLGKTISRKLMVFLIATVFVVLRHIDPEHWVGLAKIYIGVQGGVDLGMGLIGKYKDKSNKFSEDDSPKL